ncbi:MAG TPA: hypothetical protein VFV39_09635 [Limnobacter sp.]|nr:hypothetical protein [Limnobacter sp.]
MTKRKAPAKSTAKVKPAASPVAPAMPAELSAFSNHPGFSKDVRVFQIYFRPDQLHQLEPEFIPYDNALGDFSMLEYAVFRKLYQSDLTKDCKYWGALSWRFREKAMINATDLFNVIEANPGYDLYFMNPEPQIEGLYENLWVQGSTAHPNFIPLVEQLLEAVGMDKRMLSAYRHTRIMAAANYFVGSQRFWDAYIQFVENFLEKAEKNAPPALLQALKNTNADPRNLHAGANYFPFIIERLLTEFIIEQSGKLACFKIELGNKKTRLPANAHDLEWLKNQALERKDEKLLRIWVNYRNLYFKSLYGNQAKV